MQLTNTRARFGTVSKTFHWLIALGILAMLPLGLIASQLPYDTSEQLARKAFLFSVHKTLGPSHREVTVPRRQGMQTASGRHPAAPGDNRGA